MAVEHLTVDLFADSDEDISGSDYFSGVEADTHIVTLVDGGDLLASYEFDHWGEDDPDEAAHDEFHIDLSGFDDDFVIGIDSMDENDSFVVTGFDLYVVAGDIWTFSYTGTDGNPHMFVIDTKSAHDDTFVSVVVCFARGSRILTPQGERPVETLAAGSMVVCGDGLQRPVRWAGSRQLGAAELAQRPELNPVRLRKDALGTDAPARDLLLSPQHRVLLRDWRAEMLFGEPAVFVPAVSLVNDETIRQERAPEGVEYFHLLLDGHQTVFADGLECETLMPAEMATGALDGAARAEICAIFPDLAADLSRFGPLCHTAAKPAEARLLLAEVPAAQAGGGA